MLVSGITLTGASLGDFAVSGDTCSSNQVPFLGTCDVGITFTPSASGTRNASLKVSYDGVSSPLTVPLSGTGSEVIDFKAKINKITVSGPNKVKRGKKATYKVKISNSGDRDATGVGLKVSGRGVSFNTSVGKIAAGGNPDREGQDQAEAAGQDQSDLQSDLVQHQQPSSSRRRSLSGSRVSDRYLEVTAPGWGESEC